jgi:hypothetical protein
VGRWDDPFALAVILAFDRLRQFAYQWTRTYMAWAMLLCREVGSASAWLSALLGVPCGGVDALVLVSGGGARLWRERSMAEATIDPVWGARNRVLLTG